MQPIFSVISDRLFKFPQTDLLCATLFDVLLGGASPKQVMHVNWCSRFFPDNNLTQQVMPLYNVLTGGCVAKFDLFDQLFNSQCTCRNSLNYLDILFQVLQKHNQLDLQKSSRNSSQFFLPQILALIFRFLSGCKDAPTRIKIISDLLDLLDSNTTNVEALMVEI